jgi:hypothetical protein
MRWLLIALVSCGCSAPSLSAVEGTDCPTENLGRCDDGDRLLQCVDGRYQVISDCKGERGCSVMGSTVDCDTAGNSVGDRCAPMSEGRVRCDPDGGTQILRCNGGRLGVEYVCPMSRVCGLSEAGLTCL